VSPDSFLLDPFLLFVDGLLLALVWERRWRGRGLTKALPLGIGASILAIFWSVSISLWFDSAWTASFARWCGAETGRDWMLNSGVFHFDYRAPPSTALQAIAFVLFATYVGWLLLGARVGSRLGARPAK